MAEEMTPEEITTSVPRLTDATIMTPEDKVITISQLAAGLGVRFSLIVLDCNDQMIANASGADYKLNECERNEITTLAKQIIGIISSARDRRDRNLS